MAGFGSMRSKRKPSAYGQKLTSDELIDGDELVAEYDGSGAMTKRYVHGAGIDDPIVEYSGTTLANRAFLHGDQQGSIIAISDAAANATSINKYDEYGMPQGGTPTGRFAYTGQAWLPELGMYYYKARIYDPRGRFMQTDPIGYDDQINLYA